MWFIPAIAEHVQHGRSLTSEPLGGNAMKHCALVLILAAGVCFSGVQSARAQQFSPSSEQVPVVGQPDAPAGTVPHLLQFAGTLKDAAMRPVTGAASVTFAIYSDQDGGTALWSETQNVLADANGHFNVLLGGATVNGIPAELFGTGQSRWLGISTARSAEMPRVLLASVPYALRAADADTLGGLPASAYVTTQSLAASNARATTPIAGGNTTVIATPQIASAQTAGTSATNAIPQATPSGTGTTDYIPLWTSGSNLGNSILFQSGSSIGLGTTTPASTLDINGGEILRGGFYEFPQGTATASAGQPSHSFQWLASLYSSSTKAAADLAFGFRAEPATNNVANPTAKLDLFYGTGGPTGSLADTGFSFATNGIVTFASGQTFPGVAELGAPNNFETNQAFNAGLTATNPTAGIVGTASNTAGSAIGVDGQSNSTSGYGVIGQSPWIGVYGSSSGSSTTGLGSGKAGVWGDTGGGSGAGYQGVLGTADDNSAGVFLNNGSYSALLAKNQSAGKAIEGEGLGGGTGVFGGNGTLSTDGGAIAATAGVWGDVSGSSAFAAILGTADDNDAGWFYNHSDHEATVEIENASSATGPLLLAYGNASGNYCQIETNGDFSCTGSITDIATVDGARKVAQYSMQSPENWSEDFGSATLANGTATVSLEATFAQTVNARAGYHVYLTPNGDSKGLYVANKTASGFEVRESGGGTSNVAFDYRIVAKRVGYETVRLKDVTARQAQIQSNAKKLQSGAAKPAGATKSAPRSGAGTPIAAAPAISNTARQLTAPAAARTTKPVN